MDKRTAAYIRVSTEEQVKDGFSLESQEEKCNLQAKLKELAAPEVYADPGISGAEAIRPACQRLIKDIRAGRVSHVVVWRLDRLTRRLKELLEFVDLTREYGVRFISLSESIDTDSAGGRLFIKIMGSFNEYFLELQSENTRAGLQKRAKEGKWSTSAPTSGAVRNGKLVWTEKAENVVKAFEMAANDVSLKEIARVTGINVTTLIGVLHNPVYCGKVRTKYGVFDGEHEPIISETLFEQVQQVKKPPERAWTRKAKHPLSGFVRCGKCGRAMSIAYNGKSMLSYRCKHSPNGPSCDGVGVRSAQKIERAFTASLELLKDHHDFQEEMRFFWASKQTPQELKQEIKKVDRKLSKIKTQRDKMARLLLRDGIEPDDFAGIKAELAQQEAQLIKEKEAWLSYDQESKSRLESLEELLEILEKTPLKEIWVEANDEERRWILEDYVRAIVFHEDYIEIQYYDAPAFKVFWDEVNGRDVCIKMERETGLEPATFSLGS